MRPFVIALLVLVTVCGCYKPGGKKEPKPAKKKDEKIVGKFTKDLLDANVVRAEHPDWIVENPAVEGNDPFSVLGSGYDSATHSIAQLGWTKWRQMHAVLNDDRLPTFSEAQNFVQRESQGLPMVRPYRHWVYDDKTGELLLMLDVEHRNEVYREKGIAIPEG